MGKDSLLEEEKLLKMHNKFSACPQASLIRQSLAIDDITLCVNFHVNPDFDFVVILLNFCENCSTISFDDCNDEFLFIGDQINLLFKHNFTLFLKL